MKRTKEATILWSSLDTPLVRDWLGVERFVRVVPAANSGDAAGVERDLFAGVTS